ncbi:MAG: hypothetical protein CVU39_06710 [Chloroflexi bacterium HGW-Chloroflexi-10]|nr:MAG: hypothetical protein CVU39_06710 [Chloroflexi bacterium HGW-Chloroflexi-10]
MKRLFVIALKDLQINFRDVSGLIIMLVAPFALILVIGAAFGGFSGDDGSSPIAEIPVIIVNLDEGQYSAYLVEAFQSAELADLLEPQILDSVEAARILVDNDKAAAVVVVPANFSEAIVPSSILEGNFNSPVSGERAVVEVYQNPSRPVSSSIIRSIVDIILANFSSARISAQLSLEALVRSGRVTPEQLNALAPELGQKAAQNVVDSEIVQLQTQTITPTGESEGFDWLVYSVPSMAILYLMFTMTSAGRSILSERDRGTLPRMLVMPASASVILGGKMLGAFITGILQMTILLTAGTLLYQISWGSLWGLILLTIAVVAAATGWAMLIASFSKTPGQASAVGTAITLIFAASAGNFLPRGALPQWLQTASLISPNGWGLDGYTNLAAGSSITVILPAVGALFMMAAILFFIASRLFRRQYN